MRLSAVLNDLVDLWYGLIMPGRPWYDEVKPWYIGTLFWVWVTMFAALLAMALLFGLPWIAVIIGAILVSMIIRFMMRALDFGGMDSPR